MTITSNTMTISSNIKTITSNIMTISSNMLMITSNNDNDSVRRFAGRELGGQSKLFAAMQLMMTMTL